MQSSIDSFSSSLHHHWTVLCFTPHLRFGHDLHEQNYHDQHHLPLLSINKYIIISPIWIRVQFKATPNNRSINSFSSPNSRSNDVIETVHSVWEFHAWRVFVVGDQLAKGHSVNEWPLPDRMTDNDTLRFMASHKMLLPFLGDASKGPAPAMSVWQPADWLAGPIMNDTGFYNRPPARFIAFIRHDHKII